MRPDLPLWARLQDMAALTAHALRRKLTPEDLALLEARLLQALTEARAVLEPVTEEMSSNRVQNEQHHQNSQKDIHELEQRMESTERVDVGEVDSGESEGSPLPRRCPGCRLGWCCPPAPRSRLMPTGRCATGISWCGRQRLCGR